jgi:hypothetical protein
MSGPGPSAPRGRMPSWFQKMHEKHAEQVAKAEASGIPLETDAEKSEKELLKRKQQRPCGTRAATTSLTMLAAIDN